MMTPKQALIKDGKVPVKEGRGRLSREGDSRCRELASQGWSIKGYEVSQGAPNPTAEIPLPGPTVKKVKVVNEKVVQEFVILYDERQYKAINTDKKEVGMREVCNTCRVSLVQCHCGHPTILGGIAVTIVPR